MTYVDLEPVDAMDVLRAYFRELRAFRRGAHASSPVDAQLDDFPSRAWKRVTHGEYRSLTDGVGMPLPYITIEAPCVEESLPVVLRMIGDTIYLARTEYANKTTGPVLWLSPTMATCEQIKQTLSDSRHEVRRNLNLRFMDRVRVVALGGRLDRYHNQDMLSVLVFQFPPTRQRQRQLYEDAGGYGYEDFFPPEERYDLHRLLLQEVSNLDHFVYPQGSPWEQAQIKTSLANVLRVTNPIVILHEWGGTFGEDAFEQVRSLNPVIVIRFSQGAIHGASTDKMNVLVKVFLD